MSNWKNVNNWHWTEKNCLPWSKTYFEEQLVGIQVKNSSGTVKIINIKSVEGDCDLNQRKGKIFSLFDLKLNLEWAGTSASSKTNVLGNLVASEICHDSDSSDYVFEVALSSGSRPSGSALLNLARQELVKKVRDVIIGFDQALIERHMQDVHIFEKTESPSEVTTISKSADNLSSGSDVSLVFKSEFYAPTSDVYKVLTDAKLITIWSRCRATFVPVPGFPFKLFSATISGTVVSVKKYEEVILNWRSQGWPEDVFSTVTIKLEDGLESTKKIKMTKMTITQVGIPKGWKTNTERHWREEVAAPIISTFMYGKPSEHIGVRALRAISALPFYATAGFGLTTFALIYFYFAPRN